MKHYEHSQETIDRATEIVMRWLELGFGPKTKPGIRALATSLLDLTGPGMENAEPFSDLVMKWSPKCPIPLEMRRLYCEKWLPWDGISSTDPNYDFDHCFGLPPRKPDSKN